MTIKILLSLCSVFFFGISYANDPVVGSVISQEESGFLDPAIQAIVGEGTREQLSHAQINTLEKWADYAKDTVGDLVNKQGRAPIYQEISESYAALYNVATQPVARNTNVLMKFALIRGLYMVDLLQRESAANVDSAGVNVNILRVLRKTSEFTNRYYPKSKAYLLNRNTSSLPSAKVERIEFGVRFFRFITTLNRSVLDASAQYQIEKKALSWLQVDLASDARANGYASDIRDIYQLMQKMNASEPQTDVQNLERLQELRALQRDLGQVRAVMGQLTSVDYKKYQQKASNFKRYVNNSLNRPERLSRVSSTFTLPKQYFKGFDNMFWTLPEELKTYAKKKRDVRYKVCTDYKPVDQTWHEDFTGERTVSKSKKPSKVKWYYLSQSEFFDRYFTAQCMQLAERMNIPESQYSGLVCAPVENVNVVNSRCRLPSHVAKKKLQTISIALWR